MQGLRHRVEHELLSNILPFWLKHTIDDQYGGFRGQISNDLIIDPLANKGLILNARILWTFSKAFTVYQDEIYRETARRAYEYIAQYFLDPQHGGVYWMLDYQGHPVETRKRIYGQAFTVYALAEYYFSTKSTEALATARQIYEEIEKASHDETHGGYFETYERDWKLSSDQRLSAVDMDEKKSMNTHLHVMEAYATLLKAWDDDRLRKRLGNLIRIFLDRIINPQTHHFIMFFDDDWTPKSDHVSYGHDIEGSWLLCEAAEILDDHALLQEVQHEGVKMAQAVLDEAIDADGGLLYEANGTGFIDTDKHWWPQAEAVVGFLNAYQLSGKDQFRAAAEHSWDFIDKYIVDHKNGEWFWKVSRDLIPSTDRYKVDLWKCPYHNSRACLEVMTRLDAIAKPDMRKSSKSGSTK